MVPFQLKGYSTAQTRFPKEGLMERKTPLDVNLLRADFPILNRKIGSGKKLVYLDSTATAQKPTAVIDAMDAFYRLNNANIHRGVHTLAEESTAMYEKGREQVAALINAPSPRQVIFTRNTTESINLVAYSWARTNLKNGDLIILTEMEHHSNLVPWQMLEAERGVRLEFVPVTDDYRFDMDVYHELLKLEPKLVRKRSSALRTKRVPSLSWMQHSPFHTCLSMSKTWTPIFSPSRHIRWLVLLALVRSTEKWIC
jgi:hypothetical protein